MKTAYSLLSVSNGEVMVILSLIAGVAGTGIGGILGVLLKGKGSAITAKVLSFAGGVMLGVTSFDMIPEAVEKSVINGKDISGVAIGVGATVVGILVIVGINAFIDFLERRLGDKSISVAVSALTLGGAKSEKEEKRNLRAGIVMFLAIALHNFPEGMAIGAAGVAEVTSGILIAAIIAMHDVPEGMVISAPLSSGGVKPARAILLAFLAGATTVLGAVAGVLAGGVSTLSTGICMGLASGAMIYVTFSEIFPEASEMNGGELPYISAMIGLICSAVVTFAF